MQKDKKRVVVTGIGPICSLGIGAESIRNNIFHDKRTGLQMIERLVQRELWDKFYLHCVDGFDIKGFGLENEKIRYIAEWEENEENFDLFYMIAAVKLALDDSNIQYPCEQENELGLVITHENPGLEQFFWRVLNNSYCIIEGDQGISKRDFYQKLFCTTAKFGYETQSFMLLFHIARVFDIHNYSHFVNNACASGLYAIELASDMIKLDKLSKVIVVAGDYPDIFKHLWFKQHNLYASDGKIRPFANNASGFVMGAGATAIILEEHDSAIRRGAKIYAEYMGGSYNLESWGVMTPKIGSDFYCNVLEKALQNSSVAESDVDLICSHGVGVTANDYYEAKAINAIFSSTPPVTAIKPYVGHNLGGSALLELAIILLCMQENKIPATLNTDEVHLKMKINLIRKDIAADLRTIMKICCAFAGYNAAVVFRRYP